MERTIIRHIYFIKENMLLKCSRKDFAWFPRNSLTDSWKNIYTIHTHTHTHTHTHIYTHIHWHSGYVCMYIICKHYSQLW